MANPSSTSKSKSWLDLDEPVGPDFVERHPQWSGQNGVPYPTKEELYIKQQAPILKAAAEKARIASKVRLIQIEDRFFNSLIINEEDSILYKMKKSVMGSEILEQITGMTAEELTLVSLNTNPTETDQPENISEKSSECQAKYVQPTKSEKQDSKEHLSRRQFPPKPAISVGSNFAVKVSHIISPREFYIVPLEEPLCDCGTHSNILTERKDRYSSDDTDYDSTKKSTPATYTGLDAFARLIFDMGDYLENNETNKKQQNIKNAQISDLVAVRMDYTKPSIDGIFGDAPPAIWLRAIILDIYRNSDMTIAEYIVYLVDYGATVSISSENENLDICMLPKCFSDFPALAYKCNLYGIEPITSTWTKTDKENFLSLVNNKLLYMQTISSRGTDTLLNGVEEKYPYGVSLTSYSDDKRFEIGNEMVKTGVAVHVAIFDEPSFTEVYPPDEQWFFKQTNN